MFFSFLFSPAGDDNGLVEAAVGRHEPVHFPAAVVTQQPRQLIPAGGAVFAAKLADLQTILVIDNILGQLIKRCVTKCNNPSCPKPAIFRLL